MSDLMKAVLAEDEDAVRTALASGANPDVRDRAGRTPLMNAVIDGNFALVNVLLAASCDLFAKDKTGKTALHFASQEQHVDIARALLAAGAEVDAEDENGNTPLSDAVFYSQGSGDLITLLLSAGADRNRPNKYDTSPLELAQTIANFDVIQYFK